MTQKSSEHLICFDMDGVLISSMVTANTIFYGVISRELDLPLYDYPQNKTYMSLSGEDRMTTLWANEIKERGIAPEEVQRALRLYREEKLAAGIPLLPYAKEAVQLMSENFAFVACVSSNPDQLIQDFLAQLGILHHFTKITGIDYVPFAKPHPEIYSTTVDYFGLHPSQALTFEDSTPGITSAKGAGMRVIGITTGLESAEDLKKAGADLVIKDFSELTLEKVNGLLVDPPSPLYHGVAKESWTSI